jgi:IS5 family transposase
VPAAYPQLASSLSARLVVAGCLGQPRALGGHGARRHGHASIVGNRTKSKVRARVEHPIGVIKRVFGFAKLRYRGLKKNAHRLIVTCALANLFMVRRLLLRCQQV